MKKRVGCILLSLLLALTLLPLSALAAPEDLAIYEIFPGDDGVLAELVATQLGKEIDDTATDAELATIQEIVSDQPLEWMGIERLTGLQKLDLNGGAQGELQNLSTLTELTYLNIQYREEPELYLTISGRLSDLAPLTKLTHLNLAEQYDIRGKLSDLSGLTELTFLGLDGLNVTGHLSDLATLPKLTQLNLSMVEVEGNLADLAPLTDLSDLTLNDLLIEGDLADLAGMSQLTSLELAHLWNVFGSLSDIAALDKLEELTIYGMDDVDGQLSDLSSLTNLTLLDIQENYRIKDNLKDLASFTGLTELYLSSDTLQGDLKELPVFPKMEVLMLNGTEVVGELKDIPSKAPNLVILDLEYSNVLGEIGDLAPLSNLEVLWLNETQVEGDLADLAQQTALKNLQIFGTFVQGDLESLANLTDLETLDVSWTSVEGDLSSLAALKNLQLLDVSGSFVTGDLATLPASLVALWADETGIYGDPSSLPQLTYLQATDLYIELPDISFNGAPLTTEMPVRTMTGEPIEPEGLIGGAFDPATGQITWEAPLDAAGIYTYTFDYMEEDYDFACYYSGTVIQPYVTGGFSDEAALFDLSYRVDGGEWTPIPGFNPENLTYNITLPRETPRNAVVELMGTAVDPNASLETQPVELTYGAAYSPISQSAEMVVESADGASSQIYQVSFLTKTLKPAFDTSSISGIQNGASYTKGSSLAFSAVGAGMENANPALGDVRYRPTQWSLSGTSQTGSWNADSYQGKLDLSKLSAGQYTLTVTFVEEGFTPVYSEGEEVTGYAWQQNADTADKTYQKTVTFTVKSGTTTGTNTGTTTGTTTTTTNKNPKTGDESLPVWSLVAMMVLAVGCAGAAVALKKRETSKR